MTGAFANTFTPPSSGMHGPQDLTLRPDGSLYYSALGNESIQRYNEATGSFLGTFVASGSGGLQSPSGLAFGPDGNLFVANQTGNKILRYNGQTGAFLGTFVPAGSGGLSAPSGVAFGPDGHLYVSSSVSHQILRYHGQTGAFLNVFVAAGSGGLSNPKGLGFGFDGRLYICSTGTHQVLRYNGETGAFIDIFVAAGSGGLQQPTDLSFALDFHLYVCSAGTGSVLRYHGGTGAFLDTFVAAGSGGLGQPLSLQFCPPDAPSGLTATAVSSVQINLSWTDNSDEEAVLEIWRRSGTGPGMRIALVSSNTTLYSDNAGLSPNTSYSYAVRAIGPGGFSAGSNESQATTAPLGLAAPTGLAAAVVSSSRINLTWTDNSSNELAFAIFRRNGSGAFVRVGVVPPNATSFSDPSASPGSTYTYKVRASTDTTVSHWSNEVTANTPQVPPAAPTNLVAAVGSATRVNLTWTDNSNNEMAFAIFRRNGSGDFIRVGVVPPNATSFSDPSASPGSTYTYKVRASTDTTVSHWSNEVTVTTPQAPPAAPTNLAATAVSPTRVNLTWTDNSNNETAFALFRKSGAGDWVRIAVVVPNTTSFANTGLAPGTSYTYRLRAIGGDVASAWSNETTVATPF